MKNISTIEKFINGEGLLNTVLVLGIIFFTSTYFKVMSLLNPTESWAGIILNLCIALFFAGLLVTVIRNVENIYLKLTFSLLEFCAVLLFYIKFDSTFVIVFVSLLASIGIFTLSQISTRLAKRKQTASDDYNEVTLRLSEVNLGNVELTNSLSEVTSELEKVTLMLSEKDKTIESITSKLNEVTSDNQALINRLQELENKLSEVTSLEEKVTSLSSEVTDLQAEVIEYKPVYEKWNLMQQRKSDSAKASIQNKKNVTVQAIEVKPEVTSKEKEVTAKPKKATKS